MYSTPGPHVAGLPTSSTALTSDRVVRGATATPFSDVAIHAKSNTYGATPLSSTALTSDRVVRGATATPYSDVAIHATSNTYGATPTVVTAHVGHAYDLTLLRHCACEFFGTVVLFLVMVLCSNALYIAAFYAALVYAFWFFSGAHLNPAISIGAVLVGKMRIGTFGAYVGSQLAGGMVGGLLFKIFFESTSKKTLSVAVTPMVGHTLTAAIFIEVLYTVMLVFVALNLMCTQQHDKNQFFGIAIGFVIVAGGFAAIVVIGHALFNPALCIGLVMSTFKIGSCFWYILAEIVSAFIAFLLFKFCRLRDHRLDHTYEIERGFSPRGAMETGIYRTHVDTHTWSHHSTINLITRAFSEFLGTFWLVITILLNTSLSSGYAAWSGAGVLISLIYALGGVSGGHFNPAVTLAVMIDGHHKLSAKEGTWYIVAQLLAALPAGYLASFGKEVGLFGSSGGYNYFSVGFAEFVFTLVLVYVVLVVANSEVYHTSEAHWCVQPNFYYALAIGLAFVGGSSAISSISGGYLNPAVVFGFAVDVFPSLKSTVSDASLPAFLNVIMRIGAWIGMALAYLSCMLAYWIPEFLGAIVAALIVRRLGHTKEFEKADYTYEARPVHSGY